MNNKIFRIAAVGILSALSIVLVLLIHFPIFPAVAFLEYDPADVPIFIISWMFGPLYGIAMTVTVSFVQGFTVSAQSGIVGVFMHIVATGAFVLSQNLAYRKLFKSRSEQFKISFSTVFGTVGMTAVMTLWNLIVTPFYMGVPYSVLFSVFPFIVLFNLIKATINGVAAALIYSALRVPLKKYKK